VVLTANESLDDIIAVSNMLLKLLETAIIEGEKSITELANQDHEGLATTTALLKLIAQREGKIHQLFEQFSRDELPAHREKLQIMATLDSQLVEKINRVQKSAKSKILKLKKNKKAINIYQKL